MSMIGSYVFCMTTNKTSDSGTNLWILQVRDWRRKQSEGKTSSLNSQMCVLVCSSARQFIPETQYCIFISVFSSVTFSGVKYGHAVLRKVHDTFFHLTISQTLFYDPPQGRNNALVRLCEIKLESCCIPRSAAAFKNTTPRRNLGSCKRRHCEGTALKVINCPGTLLDLSRHMLGSISRSL